MARDRGRREQPTTLDVVRFQREACERAGSSLYVRILEGIAADVAAGGRCAELLGPWEANAMADAIPLRLLGGVHRIVLEGRAPDLASFYPSAGGDRDDDPVPAFQRVVEEHVDELHGAMANGVQTNEVGRACALLGGFHEVARRTGMPLRVLEIGASAGLLLHWDRYRYEAPGLGWGARSPVVFRDPWEGGVPSLLPESEVRIEERRGCDVHPIDAGTAEGRTLLRSFLWPDQRHRRARLDAAMQVAAAHPVTVDRADAADWVAQRLGEGRSGVATVVYHAIVLQYLSRDSFLRLRSTLREVGGAATPERPLFWLRMEPAGPTADLRLTAWPSADPDDGDVVLGTTGYHGPPVRWGAPPPPSGHGAPSF